MKFNLLGSFPLPLITHIHRTFLISVICLFIPLTSGLAQTPAKSVCSKNFDQCLLDCDSNYADEPAKRAVCVPTCSGKFAACDAGVAYDKAKPWLEEQARKSKQFFEGLIDKYGRDNPQPDSQEKTKDNSI